MKNPYHRSSNLLYTSVNIDSLELPKESHGQLCHPSSVQAAGVLRLCKTYSAATLPVALFYVMQTGKTLEIPAFGGGTIIPAFGVAHFFPAYFFPSRKFFPEPFYERYHRWFFVGRMSMHPRKQLWLWNLKRHPGLLPFLSLQELLSSVLCEWKCSE